MSISNKELRELGMLDKVLRKLLYSNHYENLIKKEKQNIEFLKDIVDYLPKTLNFNKFNTICSDNNLTFSEFSFSIDGNTYSFKKSVKGAYVQGDKKYFLIENGKKSIPLKDCSKLNPILLEKIVDSKVSKLEKRIHNLEESVAKIQSTLDNHVTSGKVFDFTNIN